MYYKFRRYDFVNQLLNASCVRVYDNNRLDFLPGANCLQINEYNFSSMEFPWQINCIKVFCHGCQKGLYFKIINQESHRLDQKIIVKSD